MHPNIQKALKNLESGDFASFFEELKDIIPRNQLTTFSQLRDQYIKDRYPHDFDQKLRLFASSIADSLQDDEIAPNPSSASTNSNTNIEHIKKQLMRGDVDGSIEKLHKLAEAQEDNFFINRMILISSQYNSIDTLTMKQDQVSRERAKIIRELLNLMDDLR